MKPAELDFLQALCRSRAGVRAPVDRPYLVDSKLAPLARREGFAGVEELVAAARTKREERLIWSVVEAMTANETAFFNDRQTLEAVTARLLPQLAKRRDGEPLRVWSAACATGQEIFSLAMLIDEARGGETALRADLFASDLSERCLEKAQSGLYTQFEVQRGLSARRLVRHFHKMDEAWMIDPRLRQGVRWRRINLIADLSQLGRFDVVVMRQVLNGADPAVRGRIIENIAQTVADDGFLVLASDETLPADSGLTAVKDLPGVYGRDASLRAAA